MLQPPELSLAAQRACIVVFRSGVVCIILLAALFYFPVELLRAVPRGDPLTADTAIIMGFGFERFSDGSMAPGAANRANLAFVLERYPHVTTIFAQEGVWVAECHQSERSCTIGDVTMRRIDFHDDSVDLHSADIAVCSLERMQQFGKSSAILIAHDMQLWRAAENIERAKVDICPNCQIIVPAVPDTPYPEKSDQLRTRYEHVYILFDAAARVRDRMFPAAYPSTCPMPMPTGE
ncbi:MAG: hypothetical protein AAGD96_24705 [Chloroflexota bacterium]